MKGTELTIERMPEDFLRNEVHLYWLEKKLNSKAHLTVSFERLPPTIYISDPTHQDQQFAQKEWDNGTEEKLNEIHRLFTDKDIDFLSPPKLKPDRWMLSRESEEFFNQPGLWEKKKQTSKKQPKPLH
jgi:hypothetical protein